MSDFENEHICGICFRKSVYVCPRCGINYCSLQCYRDVKHQDCSETFYRDCCLESMHNSFVNDEHKSKMLEILRREAVASTESVDQEVDPDNTDDEDGDDSDSKDEEVIDSRFSHLNMGTEDVDSDVVWALLTPKERREFCRLLKSGKLAEFIPVWNPWWRDQNLILPVTPESQPSNDVKVPPVRSLKSLLPSGKIPHESVGYTLIDILLGYVSTCRRFNGDHFDLVVESAIYFCDIVASFNVWANKPKTSVPSSNSCTDQSKTRIITPIPSSLSHQNFQTVSHVLGSVQSKLMQLNLPCSPHLMTILLEDVDFLIASPQKCMHALNDCHKVITQVKKLPDLDPSLVGKVTNAHHKLTFMRACLNPRDQIALKWQSSVLPKLRKQISLCLCEQLSQLDKYSNVPTRTAPAAGPNWRNIIRDSQTSPYQSEYKNLIETLPDP